MFAGLLDNGGPHGGLRGINGALLKDSNESALVRITYGMRPSVAAFGRCMALEVGELNSPFPHGLALKGLMYLHALDPSRITAMQIPYGFAWCVDRSFIHWAFLGVNPYRSRS